MKLKITPPDYIIILIILEIILNYVLPIKKIIDYPYNFSGVLLIIIGIIPNLWVFSHFRRLNTPIRSYEFPKKLVNFGLFKISRNPLYLGMFLILLGEAILLGSIINFLIPIIFIILTDRLVIPEKERNLEKAFGKEYLKYKKQVRRWI